MADTELTREGLCRLRPFASVSPCIREKDHQGKCAFAHHFLTLPDQKPKIKFYRQTGKDSFTAIGSVPLVDGKLLTMTEANTALRLLESK